MWQSEPNEPARMAEFVGGPADGIVLNISGMREHGRIVYPQTDPPAEYVYELINGKLVYQYGYGLKPL